MGLPTGCFIYYEKTQLPVALAPRWNELVEDWVVSITILELQHCVETLGFLFYFVEIHGVTDQPLYILWESHKKRNCLQLFTATWSKPAAVWMVSITILLLKHYIKTLSSLLYSAEIHGVTDRPPHMLWENTTACSFGSKMEQTGGSMGGFHHNIGAPMLCRNPGFTALFCRNPRGYRLAAPYIMRAYIMGEHNCL